MVHNFVNTDQILTKPIPIDNPGQDLLIGTGLVKIESVLTKLWPIKVNNVNNPGWTIGPLFPTSWFSLFLRVLIS